VSWEAFGGNSLLMVQSGGAVEESDKLSAVVAGRVCHPFWSAAWVLCSAPVSSTIPYGIATLGTFAAGTHGFVTQLKF
jgi:hypothetical protein